MQAPPGYVRVEPFSIILPAAKLVGWWIQV